MPGGHIPTRQFLICALVVALLWGFSGPARDVQRIRAGVPYAIDYISGMWPPDLSILPSLVEPLAETIQMGIVAITLSVIISIPVSFFAARETSPHIVVYAMSRSMINFLRAIPTLLWAILFVAMVGLGPLAGVFALTFHCVGALGKYFSEAIEAIAAEESVKESLEAMQIDGCNRWQMIYYGLLPAVAAIFWAYIFTYFEWSVRVGTVVGLVGAGGLGLQLTQTIRLFRRHQTLTILMVILGTVMIIDRSSRLVRKRFLA